MVGGICLDGVGATSLEVEVVSRWSGDVEGGIKVFIGWPFTVELVRWKQPCT